MTEVKTFRVHGLFRVGLKWRKFAKEARGLTQTQAIQSVQQQLGSKTKIKTNQIKINAVEEINSSSVKNSLIAKIASMGE
ncbi:MAG: 50S ribosomal protein L18Ae [Candidatus Bathyarchaeia archaeon]